MKTTSLPRPSIVSADQWHTARLELLRDEKKLLRLQDELAARRRQLPWVKLTKPYVFAGPSGPVTLADLFAGSSQLVIQHFMLGAGWDEGCKSCSFMLDHFNAAAVHLTARDVAFAAVSRAPLVEILPFKQRMGWNSLVTNSAKLVNTITAHRFNTILRRTEDCIETALTGVVK